MKNFIIQITCLILGICVKSEDIPEEVLRDEKITVIKTGDDQEEYMMFRRESVNSLGVATNYVSIIQSEDGRLKLEVCGGLESTAKFVVDPKSGEMILQLTLLKDKKSARVMYDVDIDGVWDVRKGVQYDSEILLDGRWVKVDIVEDLFSGNAKAKIGDRTYSFSHGWKLDPN